jgi:hypothetical protein
MKIVALFFLLFLSGCANLSPKTRHHIWLVEMEGQVGKSVFDCKGDRKCLRYRGDSLFQGDSVLSNGNKEAAYFMPYRKYPKCRYFFEYENESGLIIRYRYEELETFACAVIL